MKSLAVLLLLGLVSAEEVKRIPAGVEHYNNMNTFDQPVEQLEFHYNEDPHTAPDPLAGKTYMTSTEARYNRDG